MSIANLQACEAGQEVPQPRGDGYSAGAGLATPLDTRPDQREFIKTGGAAEQTLPRIQPDAGLG